MDLGHAMVGLSEYVSVIIGDPNNQGGPLSPTERDTELTGIEVQVEVRGRDSNEGSPNERHAAGDPLPQPTPVAVGESERNLSRGEADSASDASLSRLISGELRYGGAGGLWR